MPNLDAAPSVDIGDASKAWRPASETVWRLQVAAAGHRDLAQETPVALVYDATTYAVMMASPADFEDFGVGFSLNEGVISSPREIEGIDVVHGDLGVEVRMWLREQVRIALATRRRRVAGPTGCGLCGLDSLEAAARPLTPVSSSLRLTPGHVQAATDALPPVQRLGARTRAVHAAAFWTPQAGLAVVREDVGRHNALDKLAGALARSAGTARDGAVLLTSRVSVEMVQKTARMGAAVLLAVSAPTTLAVETAEAAGITLVAIVRADGFEVFTHPNRIAAEP